MLFKLIAIALVAGTVGRLLFPARWMRLGRWFGRFVDLTLVLLAIVFGAHLIMLALH